MNPGEVFNPYRVFRGLFVPDGIASCRQLRPGVKLAYAALIRFAGQDGVCFPSMQALGDRLGVSSRQARAYIAALEKKQLIRRKKRYDNLGQISNEFEFLWHNLVSGSLKKSSAGPRKDRAVSPRNDSSAEDSQTKESHSEERNADLDCLPLNPKTGESSSRNQSESVCRQYPRVRECLARYMRVPGEEKEYPTDRTIVEIMDAAGTHDEHEVNAALNYLYFERGLKPFSKNGPRSFAWFKTVLQDFFQKRRDREAAANPVGYYEWQERNEFRLAKAEFDAMTDAIEIPN